jgi:uncharacterized repeat protein (TIGR03803 family)
MEIRDMKLIRVVPILLSAIAVTLGLAISAQAQTVTFSDLTGIGSGGTGWEPYSTVTQATDGNFYGTATNGIFGGGGNIFRMTPDGEITNVYTFVCSRTTCVNGAGPQTAPILGTDGNLYGVTAGGGHGSCGSGGIVYKLTLQGKLTVLYNFASSCTDGATPNGIVLGSDGNFYGTTVYGGNNSDGPGIVFKITPAGKYTELYSFCSQANCTDGEKPFFPPVQGNDGNFYGATSGGGSFGGGVIYKITPSGQYSVIYNFCYSQQTGACVEGSYPYAITKDADGNFVGTAVGGSTGYGVVFKVTPGGQYSILTNFPNLGTFGWPGSQLTLGSDGNLYGTLIGGGSGSWAPIVRGAVYRISPNGDFTPLQAFCECGSGKGFNPIAGVFQGTDGNFYGTTAMGGIGPYTDEDWGYGTVFQYASGLGPNAQTVPAAGKAGQTVLILGNHLTGATGVTFNGVQANFTVESDTYIKATVPAGATTGAVSVVTSSGTLSSNPQFVVTK